MAGKKRYGNAAPVSDVAARLLDPLLRRRTGLSVALVQSWEEIVGPGLAGATRPERIRWPRRDEDQPFEPGTLIVACEGAAALRLQHVTGEIVERVNAFIGYPAVGRVRIVQKPVDTGRTSKKVALPQLGASERARIGNLVEKIEDEDLRAALARLGASVAARRAGR